MYAGGMAAQVTAGLQIQGVWECIGFAEPACLDVSVVEDLEAAESEEAGRDAQHH